MEASPLSPPKIAVVGLGPSGMVIVERLIAHMRAQPHRSFELLLFDCQRPGAGLHQSDLPDYFRLNTVACQLSFFPNKDAVAGHAPHQGPTFYEWCAKRDVRIGWQDKVSNSDNGRPVDPGHFLPRRLLGQYLEECAQNLIANAPRNVTLHLVKERVDDIKIDPDTELLTMITSEGRSYHANRTFLALGHEAKPQKLGKIKTDDTVAISGLGLTAIDLVAALTRGRGGIFTGGFDQLRYVPSGREPKILMFSRQGHAFHARPDWSPIDDHYRVPPIFFTCATVKRLRQAAPEGQLDFRKNLLPLIELDMCAAYLITKTRLAFGVKKANLQLAELTRLAGTPFNALEYFKDHGRPWPDFDPVMLLRTDPLIHDPLTYAQRYQTILQRDLRDCLSSVHGSPVKAALEVWRNQRDTIRFAVNGDGLTEQSRTDFYRNFAPLSNRLVGGPQKERHKELLVLCTMGIVTLLPPQEIGPDNVLKTATGQIVSADHRLIAHAGSAGTTRSDSTLIRNLIECGAITSVDRKTLMGINVDTRGHPVDKSGHHNTSLWFVGPPVEGSTFYNHYVGTPGADCPLFKNAEREVARCLSGLNHFTTKPVRRQVLAG